MLRKIFSVILGIVLVTGSDLPAYIKKCKLSDPNLNNCISERANEAIPRIVKGDPDFKLITMSPIVLPEVNLGTGSNLEMKLKEVTTNHLKNVKLSNTNFDKESNKLSYVATLDVLEVLSKYSINGRIAVLPIKGEGDSNITLTNNKMMYEAEFGIKNAGGEKFYTINKSNLKLESERVYFHFDNLFGGDPTLSKQMNEFLDTNWKDFFLELKPAIEKTIQAVVDNTFTAYISKVPTSNIFEN